MAGKKKGTLCTIVLPDVVLTKKQRKKLEEKVKDVLKEAGQGASRGSANIGISIVTIIF